MTTQIIWLTPQQVADRLQIAVGTLENWRIKKHGPPWVKLSPGKGGAVRYRLIDIEQWEAEQTATH